MLTAIIAFSPAGGRAALAQEIHGPPESVTVEKAMIAEPIAPLPITIAATADDESPAFDASLLAAFRLGVLVQDINFIGTSFEDGQAINLEIQFAAPDFLNFVLSPRPTLGGTVSTAGGTNTLYGGLNWHFRPFGQFEPFDPLFLDFFFGVSLHDGNSTDNNTADNKTLGCDVLFREALELGVEIADHYTLSVMVSHLSHGEILCSDTRNRGMDHLGVRLGYAF